MIPFLLGTVFFFPLWEKNRVDGCIGVSPYTSLLIRESMRMFSSADTIWVLLAAALVFFMQAGFAMVETGFTRAKNAGNIIMKNLMDFAVGFPRLLDHRFWADAG